MRDDRFTYWDVYRGRIVIYVGDRFLGDSHVHAREAIIAPGFVTLALHEEPNRHLEILRECDLHRDLEDIVRPLESPHITIGERVDLKGKTHIRVGRVATYREPVSPGLIIIDGAGAFSPDLSVLDLDDLRGDA